MRSSAIFRFYVARQVLAGVGGAFFVFAALLFMLDVVELGRRASRVDGAEVSLVLRMALLHLPYLAQRALPYAVLLGALLSLARLARTNEISAAGAAGLSTAQILFPAVAVGVLVGLFSVTAFSPLASAMQAGFRELDNRHLRDRATGLATPKNGLWLYRSGGKGGSEVIHAATVDPAAPSLNRVFVLRFAPGGDFAERIDAASAELRDDHWLLRDAHVNGPGHRAERFESLRLDTDLNLDRIQDSFAGPDTQSFWKLPGFISALESAGFSSLRHRLHWHSMAASPVLYAGMVLIAAFFALRPAGRRRTGWMLALGTAAGFGVYVFSDVTAAYGASGQIPYLLAAWAPGGVAVSLGGGLLLHARHG